MVIDPDVDPTVVEACVSAAVPDDEDRRALLASLVAAGPQAVLAYACVATAPTRATANGTTAPTATNLDSTATPRSFVFGSNATILNVEGRARVIAAGNGQTLFRRFPAPVTLMLVPQLRDLVDARPPRSVRSPARPREDVSRVSGASCGAPLGPFRRRTGGVEARTRRSLGDVPPAGQLGGLGIERIRGYRRRARCTTPLGDLRPSGRRRPARGRPRRVAGIRKGGDVSRQRAIPGCTYRNRAAPIGRTPGVRGHGRQRDERRSAPWRRPVRPDRRDLHGPFAERAERTVPVLARDSASTRSPAPGLCPRR